MNESFRGKVRRAYAMNDQQVLVLEDGYTGDIEIGQSLKVSGAEGEQEGKIVNLAWGSAFHAESPPLTLVVEGLRLQGLDGATVLG